VSVSIVTAKIVAATGKATIARNVSTSAKNRNDVARNTVKSRDIIVRNSSEADRNERGMLRGNRFLREWTVIDTQNNRPGGSRCFSYLPALE
jgi:hypothetical protein